MPDKHRSETPDLEFVKVRHRHRSRRHRSWGRWTHSLPERLPNALVVFAYLLGAWFVVCLLTSGWRRERYLEYAKQHLEAARPLKGYYQLARTDPEMAWGFQSQSDWHYRMSKKYAAAAQSPWLPAWPDALSW
jgi:hypothetical protein